MPAARREMSMYQLTSEVYVLQGQVNKLQCEVSKLLHVQRTLSTCIKVLWGIMGPVIVGLLVRWFVKGV